MWFSLQAQDKSRRKANEAANALKQYYQDDVRELERLLDIDLAIWELT